MEKQYLFLNPMSSNCSISNENTLQYIINFRIYKYQWSLQLAVYLPRRERWANLHFLRVKWEMFWVYGKRYLFQLTYTITWYMSLVTWQCYNNLVTRAQGASLKNFPVLGNDLFHPSLTETLKCYLFHVCKGFELKSVTNKKVKLRWTKYKKSPHYYYYFYNKLVYFWFSVFYLNWLIQQENRNQLTRTIY